MRRLLPFVLFSLFAIPALAQSEGTQSDNTISFDDPNDTRDTISFDEPPVYVAPTPAPATPSPSPAAPPVSAAPTVTPATTTTPPASTPPETKAPAPAPAPTPPPAPILPTASTRAGKPGMIVDSKNRPLTGAKLRALQERLDAEQKQWQEKQEKKTEIGFDPKAKRDANGNPIVENAPPAKPASDTMQRNDRDGLRSDRDLLKQR
jgi:hypothetical protein